MTIDQFQAQFSEAIAGLAGGAEVRFAADTGKSPSVQFSDINQVSQIGPVNIVYPEPGSTLPAYVLVRFD